MHSASGRQTITTKQLLLTSWVESSRVLRQSWTGLQVQDTVHWRLFWRACARNAAPSADVMINLWMSHAMQNWHVTTGLIVVHHVPSWLWLPQRKRKRQRNLKDRNERQSEGITFSPNKIILEEIRVKRLRVQKGKVARNRGKLKKRETRQRSNSSFRKIQKACRGNIFPKFLHKKNSVQVHLIFWLDHAACSGCFCATAS